MLGHSQILSRQMTNLIEIKKQCDSCESCGLHKTRTNIVFSDGNETSKILLIGEAPGENEDLQGKPFVGRAGKLLDKYLELAGLNREKDLYIANIVKCRPPKNRVPSKIEKAACKHYLLEQILSVNPKLILLCGSTSMDEFLPNNKITIVHGQVFDIDIEGKVFKAMPILHPSPLCRVPDKQTVMVEDLKKVKELVF